jgi:hypothetical protein
MFIFSTQASEIRGLGRVVYPGLKLEDRYVWAKRDSNATKALTYSYNHLQPGGTLPESRWNY